jgi:hypothetical protein
MKESKLRRKAYKRELT